SATVTGEPLWRLYKRVSMISTAVSANQSGSKMPFVAKLRMMSAKLEAGGLHVCGASAETWSHPSPSLVERLTQCLQLVRAVWRVFNEPTGLHTPVRPPARAAATLQLLLV